MTKQNHLIKAPFDPSPYAERIEALMREMTVAEKVGQLNLIDASEDETVGQWNPGQPADPESLVSEIRRGSVGAVLCRGFEKNNNIQRIAVEESRLGIPLLFGFDVIHGHKTVFPIPLGGSATWDPEILRLAEEASAKEAYADGINWVYAPMIDLCRDPRWGRVAEGAGEDPLLGSLIAQAKVKGFQSVNPDTGYPYVAACFKHYCGYGLSQGGRDYDECDAGERTLFSDYMKPYEAAVDAGAMSAMSSFNVLNGEPVTSSRYYLTEVLRERYGFGGFVVSDYNSVKELICHRVAEDTEDAAYLALSAGVDLDMCSRTFASSCEKLCNEDADFASAVDEAVRRILGVKFAIGLFEHPYRDLHEEFTLAPETRALAREVARRSIVLLENKNGTLPLARNKKYFVTGPLADSERDMAGTWSTCFRGNRIYTVKAAMEDAGVSFLYHEGCPIISETGDTDFSEALGMASECDEVIFVCGEIAHWSGECAGRSSITLPKVQEDYLRALKALGCRITSVLMSGRPLACPELARLSDGLIAAWHGGSEAGHAVCDCLFGDFNPSGRLPITFPYSTGQIPNYHSMLSSGRPRERFGRYRDCTHEPLYPFGYGLSYSEVVYRDAVIENPVIAKDGTLRVRVTLENVSDRDACETVQAYFRDVVSSVATPDRKLCGFVKAEIPAGGKAAVQLLIPAERFSLVTRDLREVVESGKFLLFVGHDSTCTEALEFRIE